MPLWLKASGLVGSIMVLIALVIAFLKQLIAFIGFLTFAFKIAVVLLFIAVIGGVGFLIIKGMNDRKRSGD
jgi:multisubunit Na+/H+ antiporter MnhG subunit